MNDPVYLRRYIREVLSMAPKSHFRERMIFDGVQRLTRDPLEVDEFKAALAWNAAKGFCENKEDEDSALPGEQAPLLWIITTAGLKKQGLA